MTKTEIREQALSLPLEERFELADELWASIQREQDQLPLWTWQKEILEERLRKLDQNPDAGGTWEEVKTEIWPES